MVTGWIEQKRRYRRYKARTKQLPANYDTAIDALERYMQCLGPGKADSSSTTAETAPPATASAAPERPTPRQRSQERVTLQDSPTNPETT
jgi:hypothetical protein